MGRLQVNIEGITARPNTSWAVTGQFATAADITSIGAMSTLLTTAFATLSGSTAFKAGIGANFTVQRLHGLYYPVVNGPASVVGDSTGTPFVGTNPAAVPSLATVISERTAAAGASNRGRSYWPMGSAGANDGTISTTAQATARASWRAWHDAVIAAATGAGLTPVHVVYSRKTGNMTPIVGYCTGNRIDSARGRMGKDRETYVCEATPAALAVGPAGSGADLDPSALSPEWAALVGDGNLTQDELQALADKLNDSRTIDRLGPLEVLWDVAKTVIDLRAAP